MGGRHPPQWSKQWWTGRFELHAPSPPTPPLPSNRGGKKCIPQLLALRAPESPSLLPPHYLPPLGILVQPHKPSFPDPEGGLLKPLPLVVLRYGSAPGLATRYISSGLWCQALPVSINVTLLHAQTRPSVTVTVPSFLHAVVQAACIDPARRQGRLPGPALRGSGVSQGADPQEHLQRREEAAPGTRGEGPLWRRQVALGLPGAHGAGGGAVQAGSAPLGSRPLHGW